MLSKLIVESYTLLVEIYLWLVLAVASIVGYQATVPLMHSAGLILDFEFTWKIAGALAFPVIAFLFLSVAFGPLLVLVDIRHAVRNIEAKAHGERISGERIGWLHPERKEPT